MTCELGNFRAVTKISLMNASSKSFLTVASARGKELAGDDGGEVGGEVNGEDTGENTEDRGDFKSEDAGDNVGEPRGVASTIDIAISRGESSAISRNQYQCMMDIR
jgi:hypothetical protein